MGRASQCGSHRGTVWAAAPAGRARKLRRFYSTLSLLKLSDCGHGSGHSAPRPPPALVPPASPLRALALLLSFTRFLFVLRCSAPRLILGDNGPGQRPLTPWSSQLLPTRLDMARVPP